MEKLAREKIGAIRHPETGEFVQVIVEGKTLGDMRIQCEGSPELMALIRNNVSPEQPRFDSGELLMPSVFLSFAHEDYVLAKNIAEQLQSQGIDTWWAEWEIGAGDSIRRKIDDGLTKCTHFVVLLTPTSMNRPWVNEEMDAGFVLKIRERCRFIPLLHGISRQELPPLLSGIHSYEIHNSHESMQQLINDIHGLTRKPPLGSAPLNGMPPKSNYSPAATAIARMFVENSKHGHLGDPTFRQLQIVESTGLSKEDVEDALHELNGLIRSRFETVMPTPRLFCEFDSLWKPWIPSMDALKLAADLVNDHEFPAAPAEIASRYGWSPRQLNSAITYLSDRGAIKVLAGIATGHYIAHAIACTSATRRFLKSRS